MDITIHESFLPHDGPDVSLGFYRATLGLEVRWPPDLDGTFEQVQGASGTEVVQERTEQPYGVRDCALRDPAGNPMRIQERR